MENVLDNTVVTAVLKPHLFHPTLFPARRLALVYGYKNDQKSLTIDKEGDLKDNSKALKKIKFYHRVG